MRLSIYTQASKFKNENVLSSDPYKSVFSFLPSPLVLDSVPYHDSAVESQDQPGWAAKAFNLSAWEVEARGSGGQSS